MAQKVEIHLEHDLDGGSADDAIRFSLDGTDYEIDPSAVDAEKLREVLRPYPAAGRRTTRTSSPRSTRSRASSSARTLRRSAPGPKRTASRSPTAAVST